MKTPTTYRSTRIQDILSEEMSLTGQHELTGAIKSILPGDTSGRGKLFVLVGSAQKSRLICMAQAFAKRKGIRATFFCLADSDWVAEWGGMLAKSMQEDDLAVIAIIKIARGSLEHNGEQLLFKGYPATIITSHDRV